MRDRFGAHSGRSERTAALTCLTKMSQGSSVSACWFSLFDNGTNYCNLRNIMKGRWSSHKQARVPADPQSLCCHFSSKQEVDSPRLPVLLNSLTSGCVWVTSSLPASSQLGGKIWVSFANTPHPKKIPKCL